VTGPAGADDLDPVIHAPARLRIMATLAALKDGDSLSFSRLQQLLGLTAGNLITHLRKLEDAGYLLSTRSRPDGGAGHTAVRLTLDGRAALERYSRVLRALLEPAEPAGSPEPAGPAE